MARIEAHGHEYLHNFERGSLLLMLTLWIKSQSHHICEIQHRPRWSRRPCFSCLTIRYRSRNITKIQALALWSFIKIIGVLETDISMGPIAWFVESS